MLGRGVGLPRAQMKVTHSSTQERVAMLVTPCIWWWGGAGWDHMAPEGSPEGWWTASPVVAGALSPVPFISRCLGLPPHMVPRRSVELLPLLETACLLQKCQREVGG